MKKLISQLCVVILCSSCHESASSQTGDPLYEQAAFKEYWYAGKAEIVSYDLQQARYGETHQGNAVLIFVTEDFSEQKQVKLDDPQANTRDKVNVLKLNFTKKFTTGIYPYSMMLSVFTPVNQKKHSHSLKATMSSQEWCGHVYTQLNLKNNKYQVASYSYFEQEGDELITTPAALLEDELWNMIRLDPDCLPTGEMQVLPGLFHTRLNHTGYASQKALIEKSANGSLINYTLTYPSIGRVLSIQFEKTFPHKIVGWKETFTDNTGRKMQTTATLNKTLVVDYWTKNKNQYRHLRDSLGLKD